MKRRIGVYNSYNFRGSVEWEQRSFLKKKKNEHRIVHRYLSLFAPPECVYT